MPRHFDVKQPRDVDQKKEDEWHRLQLRRFMAVNGITGYEMARSVNYNPQTIYGFLSPNRPGRCSEGFMWRFALRYGWEEAMATFNSFPG